MRNLRLPLLAITIALSGAGVIAHWLMPSSLVLLPRAGSAQGERSAVAASPRSADLQQVISVSSLSNSSPSAPSVHPAVPAISAGEFIGRKHGAVIQDDFGNFRVDLSTRGFASREYLVSARPIYYPQEVMLDSPAQIQGCPLVGYYIEGGSHGSLLVVSAGGFRVFHYRCQFDVARSVFHLQKLADNPVLDGSLNQLLAAAATLPAKKSQ
ncbi:hypothetical protein [Microbulbifer agarilyticus]|uniref:hypothetical protein n=1 Tax=Microbulbifer agarilyticus TaxID=260552 RepID=UPI0012F9EF97|nr:hypothetical protein [Microbulbifer agarilyticus]